MNTKKFFTLLLSVLLVLSPLFACVGSKDVSPITIDENGVASWEAIEGAVGYDYLFVDINDTSVAEEYTEETSVPLPEGKCLHLRAVYSDGSRGDWIASDFFGEPTSWQSEEPPVVAEPSEVPTEPDADIKYLDFHYDVLLEDVNTWNLMEHQDVSTIIQDGEVLTFSAKGPHGTDIRFVGNGVSYEDGVLRFSSESTLLALDSIGRVCAYIPYVTEDSPSDTGISFLGGYSFDGRISVNGLDELFPSYGYGNSVEDVRDENYSYTSGMDKQVNMPGIGSFQGEFGLTELTIYYDEATYAAPLLEAQLLPSHYGFYLEGEHYDSSREVYDPDQRIYTFYLMLLPELQDEISPNPRSVIIDERYAQTRSVQNLPMDRYVIGNLKDSDGNVLDKQSEPLTVGCTLEITVAGQTLDMELPIVPRYNGAANYHELLPYSAQPSVGEVTPLVIPMVPSDHTDFDREAERIRLQQEVGRVLALDGTVTDYSAEGAPSLSLSSYYDAVSLGQHKITSFVSDWIEIPYTVEELTGVSVGAHSLPEEAVQMVKLRYPELDWSIFDRNEDGLIDSAVLYLAQPITDTVDLVGFGGAAHFSRGYTAENRGTPEDPVLKDFINMGSATIDWHNTLIHEYAHSLGLIDYYDTSYTGIDAVGQFDMQSGSYGDWNPYSKYAVGWIRPEIITGLAPGESVDITIGSQEKTGDAIVIPAAGTEMDGPFGEYLMVDLFTCTGVNADDGASFGLTDAVGVRIYHVNAHMERRELEGSDGVIYPIGTPHIGNTYSKNGRYHLELLQRGGRNTFTALNGGDTFLKPADLFRAGDVFEAARYAQFLTNGRMDSGADFGYTIQVISIEQNGADSTAVIRITAT